MSLRDLHPRLLAMANVPQPAPQQDFLAGLLSYLVPGLGQIYQGRIGKGILFLAGVYGLFFYGMFLGKWQSTPYELRNGTQTENRGGASPVEAPKEYAGETIGEQQTNDDKSYDIGWVCTVVAGVLNILVIYDAFAGPAITAEALA